MGSAQILVDAALLLLLLSLLWRLRHDPSQHWDARARELRRVCDSLHSMVAQAETTARDLDRSLDERMKQVSELLETASAARARPLPPARDERQPGELEGLLAGGLSPEEAARRLGIPVAEVRVAARIGAWRKKGPEGSGRG